MKRRHFVRKSCAALLTVVLSVAFIPGALALAREGATESQQAGDASAAASGSQPTSTATFEKSEVVYASLAADGAPEAVYVVNRFDVSEAGTVVDRGAYTSVQNLTSESALAREGEATVFEAQEGTLYYQGDAAKTALPWKVDIAYTLDGRSVTADQLAGASGALAIHVMTTRNSAVDAAFCDSFMLQITFTLPGELCQDVAAPRGTVASAGQDRTVAFTSLPGHEGDFELTAQVRDFHMAGAQIAALPYNSVIDVPDTDGMVEGMDDLSKAVSQLADGTASLATGVEELTGGARDLSSGAAQFGQGLSELQGSSGAIVGVSKDIKDALASIAQGLSGADFSQISDLKQLPDALEQMAGGLDKLREGVAKVQTGYNQAFSALDRAMAAIPTPTVGEQEIGSLAALAATSANPADKQTLDELVATYQAAQIAKGTYENAKAAFTGAQTLFGTLAADAQSEGSLAQQAAALRAMASSLNASVGDGQLDQLPALASGISELSQNYGQFHKGLAQYAQGLGALAANYGEISTGVAALADGTSQLAGGASQLNSGMGELNAVTITLPDEMRAQIKEAMADYEFPPFDPVSFMSPDNVVTEVQFVMSTAAIETPEPPKEEQPEPEPTLWDRFVALFQG